MSPEQLYTILIVAAAVLVLVILVLWCRIERDTILGEQDAFDGRRLREAAGSREHIENAISDANLCRLLRRKDEQTDEAIRIGIRHLARTDKVLHFPPQLRIVRGGQPLDFPPDGGGEAA